MSGYTRGPWSRSWVVGALRHINRNVDSEAFWFPDENENKYEVAHPGRNEADYDLVTAAPDLLEACELVLQTTDPAVLDVVRAAVKKARGPK